MKEFDLYFKSGNDIPVERAVIPASVGNAVIAEISRLNAKISELEKVWQPIETADKYAGNMLLWIPEFGAWADTCWTGRWLHSEQCWGICTPGSVDGKQFIVTGGPVPTHWMPLPDVPGNKE